MVRYIDAYNNSSVLSAEPSVIEEMNVDEFSNVMLRLRGSNNVQCRLWDRYPEVDSEWFLLGIHEHALTNTALCTFIKIPMLFVREEMASMYVNFENYAAQ